MTSLEARFCRRSWNKVTDLIMRNKDWIRENPMKTVLIVLGSFVGLIWFCMRFVADDLPNDFCTRAEGKERATRLDGYQRDRDAMVALHFRG